MDTQRAQMESNFHFGIVVDSCFPEKLVTVGPRDLPYFSEPLRRLKRNRLRAYDRHGRRSREYQEAKEAFEVKLNREAVKYREKVTQEVRDGKRGSAYSAIRKLGNRPGDHERPEFLLPAYVEEQLTPQQSAEGLADHFSQIYQTVEPLEVNKLYPAPALREAFGDGLTSTNSRSSSCLRKDSQDQEAPLKCPKGCPMSPCKRESI